MADEDPSAPADAAPMLPPPSPASQLRVDGPPAPAEVTGPPPKPPAADTQAGAAIPGVDTSDAKAPGDAPKAAPAATNTTPSAAYSTTSALARSMVSKFDQSNVFVLLLLIVAAIALMVSGGEMISRISNPAAARGLITIALCFGTIALAFILIYQSADPAVSDDAFRRSREIYAGLLGILGTIVGFYFGSSSGGDPKLSLAAAQFTSTGVVTRVEGGSSPYQWTVTPKLAKDVHGPAAAASGLSSDGWIRADYLNIKDIESVDIDVKDSHGVTTAGKTKHPDEVSATQPAPAPAPALPTPAGAGSDAASSNGH